jgi:nucleoside diphosphate kinase
MLQKPREFVFIMLKPAALKNKKTNNFIKQKLLEYGDIKHGEIVVVEKKTIAEHYKSSSSSFWYPLLINYLSNKTVEHFILEFKPNKHNLFIDNTENSFADFLRKQVIGPANLFKTKEFHIRRLALSIHSGFLLDNLIHCSANTKEALDEIRIWYKDYPTVIEEFETKALNIHR